MKIIHDKGVYVLPLELGINILVGNSYKTDLTEKLIAYFASGKKSCVIQDDSGDLISRKDFNFIYFPYGSNIIANYELKEKTVLNNALLRLMEMNPEKWQSLDRLRNEMFNLETDSGTFSVLNEMKKGTDLNFEFKLDDVNLSALMSMYKVNVSSEDEIGQYMAIYNLLLYCHSKENNIVFIDFPINDKTYHWLDNVSKNNYVILDNEAIQSLEKCSAIVALSNDDFVEKVELDRVSIKLLSYLFKSVVLDNREFQTEKNKEIMDRFMDKNATYLIKIDDLHSLEML